jgi:tetratricopeptide (TPR) repeat protein
MERFQLRRLRAALGGAALVLGASEAIVSAQAAAARSTPAATESHRLRMQALEHGFNLDHAEALSSFRAAIAADPSDPAAYRLTAATIWIQSLFLQGAVTADDYLGQVKSKIDRKPPSGEMAAAFRTNLDRAIALAEARVQANPRDADGHFQVGAAYGFQASYTATAEGRVMGGFGAARRAYREHKRVLELDPRRKDAGLIVGMYRYAVSLLPWHWRALAGLAGFDGGRDRGIELIEVAASDPSDVQANALFTLVVIYNREKRYDDALRAIGDLQRRFPRNRLLWLEAGTTLLRAGRCTAARDALEQGLKELAADRRPRAFGEEARWRYAYGAALVRLGESEAAERELRAVVAGEAHDWVRGRAHMELEKLKRLRPERGAGSPSER